MDLVFIRPKTRGFIKFVGDGFSLPRAKETRGVTAILLTMDFSLPHAIQTRGFIANLLTMDFSLPRAIQTRGFIANLLTMDFSLPQAKNERLHCKLNDEELEL